MFINSAHSTEASIAPTLLTAALGVAVVLSMGVHTPGIAIPIVFFSVATAFMYVCKLVA